MRDPEDPSAKVFPRSAQLEMVEEGQEHFLDDFLVGVHGYAERKGIPSSVRPVRRYTPEELSLDRTKTERAGRCQT